MDKSIAASEIVEVCKLLVANTARCERRLERYFAFYGEGMGERPGNECRPNAVLNPKLNGTCALYKRLRMALGEYLPCTLPEGCVVAMLDFTKSAMAFVEVLESYRPVESLSVSYTAVYDIFGYMTVSGKVPIDYEMHRCVLKNKFKALKQSYYANSQAGYDIATQLERAWGDVNGRDPHSVDGMLERLRAKRRPSPQEVVVVGVEKGARLANGAVAKVKRKVSVAESVALLSGACARAMLADKALSESTFKRWESGKTTPKCGYTAACRDSTQAFMAWVQCYVADCRAAIAAKRAKERYIEGKAYAARAE